MTVENGDKLFFEGEKDNPFITPSGYFVDSRARILEEISREDRSKTIGGSGIGKKILWLSGMAASLIIGAILFQNLFLKPQQDLKMAQELEWFVNSAGSDLNEVTLASYLVEEGISMDDPYDEVLENERSSLMEMSNYDELFVIEEWMKIENQKK